MNKLLFLFLGAVFVLLLVLVLPTSNALAFGFGSGSGNTTQSMTTYKDPQSRFTILQPFNWTATPQPDRFDQKLVSFNDGAGNTINVAFVPNSANDDVRSLTQLAESLISFPFTVFQPTECIKYKVQGQTACSFIIIKAPETNLGTVGRVGIQVNSHVNGQIYSIIFAGNENKFDSILPTFEKMIHSLNFTGGVTSK